MPISTRTHGQIDYIAAAAFAALAGATKLSPPIRAVLGTAAAYHTTYSTLTNYEAGLKPRLPMRTHLALDILGGLALIGAGWSMRRQPTTARTLLIAAGLSELMVVALTNPSPPSAAPTPHNHETPAYPPLDVPKPVAENLYIVDSILPGPLGHVISTRMTVIRLTNGDLLLHSPTRFTPNLLTRLQAIGPIRHLLAPNLAHWMFMQDWQRACPGAITWTAPGVAQRGPVRRSGLRIDHELTETTPQPWTRDLDLIMVPGGANFHEAALFHKTSRTLILTDLVLNLDLPKTPPLLRPLLRLFGVIAPDGIPPPYLRAIVKLQRRKATRAAHRLLDLNPDRVIFAHGRWFEHNATAALRRSFRWLIDA